MMNLEQIRDIRFHKARKGYMPDEVDEFIEEVITAFEELLNTQTADRQKLAEAEQVAADCRAKEQHIDEALTEAQNRADAIIKAAENRAEEIVQEAKAQADAMIAEAEQTVVCRQQAADAIMHETSVFKARMMELYRHQLELTEAMPVELPPEPVEEETPEVPDEPQKNPEKKKPGLIPGSHEGDLLSLFQSDDDEDEEEPKSNSRYEQLEFGTEYEEPAARGLFRRKK